MSSLRSPDTTRVLNPIVMVSVWRRLSDFDGRWNKKPLELCVSDSSGPLKPFACAVQAQTSGGGETSQANPEHETLDPKPPRNSLQAWGAFVDVSGHGSLSLC